MTFQEMLGEAKEVHQEHFSDCIQYRGKPSEDFEEIPAIPYAETPNWKRVQTVWTKVLERQFVVDCCTLKTPYKDGQIEYEGNRYCIKGFAKSRSNRWLITAERDTVTEISRPAYRGRNNS